MEVSQLLSLVFLLTFHQTLANSSCCYNETFFLQSCCNETSPSNIQTDCCKNSTNNLCLNRTATEVCKHNVAKLKEIHIGAFVTYASSDRYGYKKAMEYALEIINNRSDILPGYKLVIHYKDTVYGDGGLALQGLFQLLSTPPKKVLLIGPPKTQPLDLIAQSAPRWKLLQISYASISPIFSKNFPFGYTYRMNPSSESNSKAKLSLIKNFGWKRVAIVHEYSSDLFSLTVKSLMTLARQRNVSIITVEGFQRGPNVDISFEIAKLKKMDARIIIGEFSTQAAQHVFCEAYKQKLYGTQYAWIVFGHLEPNRILTLTNANPIDCTRSQLKEALQGILATAQLDLRQDNLSTISGLTAMEFYNEMKKGKRKTHTINSFAFDAVWTAALALGRASKTEAKPETFTYESSKHLDTFKQLVNKTNFEGISGPVRFSSLRERVGTVLIQQLLNESWRRVGQHFTFSDRLDMYGEVKWLGGRPPKDRTTRIEEFLTNPLPLIVVMWFMAGVGTLLSILFLYFNIAHRGNRFIKMSSPQLNNFIILGCLLCYASVVLFGLDARFLTLESYGFSCNARTAVLSIGFSLSFGAMFSKTWRVHKIFTAAKTLKKMAIRDIHLFGIVAALVIIDLFYLSVWFGYDPLEATKIKFVLQERKEHDTIIIPVLYQCTCTNKTYFLAILYAYKGILLLFGLFLAWETRNVTIPALNDSKYIGMSVYNVVTLSCIGAIVTTALDGTIHHQAPYAITSLCLIICTTATLLLVFVPKVYNFVTRSDENGFSVTTVNNVQSTIGRHQSHGFRFNSESDSKACYLSKAVQTEHQELSTSTGSNVDKTDRGSRVNSAYEIQIDDIELKESPAYPMESNAYPNGAPTYPKQFPRQCSPCNGIETLIVTNM